MAAANILLIEDNEENLELAVYLLEEADLGVRAARNVDEFAAAMREPVPSLVLLDIHFPGRDGLDLLREIRARDDYRSTPVIAVTAHAMRGDKERFLQAGCDGYISKPIDVATFVGDVRRFLEKGRA